MPTKIYRRKTETLCKPVLAIGATNFQNPSKLSRTLPPKSLLPGRHPKIKPRQVYDLNELILIVPECLWEIRLGPDPVRFRHDNLQKYRRLVDRDLTRSGPPQVSSENSAQNRTTNCVAARVFVFRRHNNRP